MEVATSSLRSKLSASFRAWWETASRPLRIFTVGGSTVGVSVLLIQVSGPDRLIFGLMAAGGILLTAAFLLDLYHAALRAWEWPLGKIVGTLGATMVVAVSMALASVTVKEATGIDMGEIVRANSIQAKTDRNINIMTQGEQPENSQKEGGDKAMERVEGGYLIHEKNLNGEEVTHFRPDVTEEEKAIMKDKKAKD